MLTPSERKIKNKNKSENSKVSLFLSFIFVTLPFVIIFDPRSSSIGFWVKLNTWMVIGVPALLFQLFSPSSLDWFATDGYPKLIELKNKILTPKKPEYASKYLYPWEFIFVLKKGYIDEDDTILSYLFWLCYRGFLVLEKSDNGIVYKVKSEPKLWDDYISKDFAHLVCQNAGKNLSIAVFEIKKNSNQFFDLVENRLKPIYKKYFYPKHGKIRLDAFFAVSFLVVFTIVFCLMALVLLYFRTKIAILSNPVTLCFVLLGLTISYTLPIKNFVNRIAIMRSDRSYIYDSVIGYKLYLDKVEKNKLGFSNSMIQQLQTYNIHLSYIASLGYLNDISQYLDYGTNDKVDIYLQDNLNISKNEISEVLKEGKVVIESGILKKVMIAMLIMFFTPTILGFIFLISVLLVNLVKG
jgi:hypothetical protein